MKAHYQRQMMISQIGESGQARLQASRVTVIGAGGLGSPVLTYLAGAGVGKLTLIDGDTLSESNLNRQFLYPADALGSPKSELAKARIETFNPSVQVTCHQAFLEEDNQAALMGSPDVIVDCVDNIPTRHLVARYGRKQGIPVVEGGVMGFWGWLFCSMPEGACFGCLGSQLPAPQKTPALGAVAGIIGSLQATECLKLLLGMGTAYPGTLLQYDGLHGDFDTIPVAQNPNCPCCASNPQ